MMLALALAVAQWTKIHATSEFWAEGAAAGDVDRDGRVDVLSGPFWYAGPAFKSRREIYPARASYRRDPSGCGVSRDTRAGRTATPTTS